MRRFSIGVFILFCFGCGDETSEPVPTMDAAADAALDAALDATLDAMDLDMTVDAALDSAVDGMGPVPDARPLLMPDELPTAGEANLEGVADLLPMVMVGIARAGRVDSEDERLTGPEAKCRVGDFRLDNARISVCIQAETTFSQMSSAGGNIIDAHLADRPGTDALREIDNAPGLGSVSVDRIGIVRDGQEGGPAILRVDGIAMGSRVIQNVLPGSFVPPAMAVTTEYRLSPDVAHVEVLSWIQGRPGGQGLIDWTDLVYFGDSTRLIHPAPITDALETDLPWVAADAQDVSYGWLSEAGPLTAFAIPGLDLPGTPARIATPVIRDGDVVLHRRRFSVGEDIESVRPIPAGAVAVTINGLPGVRVDVRDADMVDVTRVRLNPEGVGRVSLLPGTYSVSTFQHQGGDVTRAVDVEEQPISVDLDLPIAGHLTLTINGADENPLAARVVLSGPVRHRLFVVDEERVSLPVGTYRVVVTRGWHFSAVVEEVDVVAGEDAALEVILTELIPGHGWVGGEFHQHSAPSLDSQVAIETRILSNMAEGVEFMVPSDHDVLEDFGPFVRRMGMAHRIAIPLTGIEVSPVFTHFGAYGIPHDPYANAGGAPALSEPVDGFWASKTVPKLFAEVRAAGARLLQINHPRSRAGYFGHVGYDPEVDVSTLDPEKFSPNFNSVEVFNRRSEFCTVFADWMGFLNQGLRITGVGNSDTHSESSPPGYPRNYLPSAAATAAGVTADEIVEAVQGGVVTVGAGAVIDFPDGPQPGDAFTAADGTARIRVRIRTPDFANIHRLVVFANGAAVMDRSLEGEAEAIVDFDEVVEVPIGDGAHVIFLALGDDSLDYVEVGSPVFAFSNPIWVDRDGQGVAPVGPGPITLPEMNICN